MTEDKNAFYFTDRELKWYKELVLLYVRKAYVVTI